MRPINLLVDSHADDGLTNAQMINAREIVSRLDSKQFAVTMFTCESPAREIARRPNVRLIQLPARLQTIPLLARYLFGKQDIVFYLKASPAGRWFLRLRSLCRTQSVTVATIESQTDWQDETVTRRTMRLVEQTVLRSDYLFSNSVFVKQSLAKNYGLNSEVVPTGVDTSFFAPDCERLANPRPRVLFVGSLRTFKGPHVVLDAAECFPQADFVVVGDGVLARQLHERAKALQNVIMKGSVGRAAVRCEYQSADIFLFPSRWEGSPRVLMEAAACGLPVIARKDYEPESVVDGVTGYLTVSEEDLMARLAQLISNPDLCKTVGLAGRRHIARFSWDAIVRQWESIFIRLVEERRKVPQS
jgi:glycosyltransferase involved in cell wall biosynthesis